ncbi:hypothetical protein BDR04DRAFT_1098377 [Suillus decipiens]|nr:hypothetical protein BDR04DRAFT_1098377 [Suillus decipiens]
MTGVLVFQSLVSSSSVCTQSWFQLPRSKRFERGYYHERPSIISGMNLNAGYFGQDARSYNPFHGFHAITDNFVIELVPLFGDHALEILYVTWMARPN